LFLAIGAYLGYRSGGWSGVADRVGNWRIVVAFGCYLPWALMQQTLFQFYLLGRLLALFPRTKPFIAIAFTSLAVGLVHLPDVWTALVTVAAGFIWSFIYYRYRLLLPLAVSHAALGSAFYYGLFGHDLAVEWRAILP
jgi:membrane protease YdiL (CAAX protease family)